MIQIINIILLVISLSNSEGFHAEISLIDKAYPMSLKIICSPLSDNLGFNKTYQVLWHGTQLGEDERQKISEKLDMDLLIHNMSINASKRHLCYLVAPVNFLRKLTILKKRITRDDASGIASIPMENGVCPPGHRIDQDRCFPCFPGSYTSGQETECFLCPKDFFMSKQAADSCWPCPKGKKTLAQGSDSEESCIYLDDTGHAEIKQSPPWIAIYIMIAVILLCVWIIIIIFFIRYWKTKKEDDSDEEELSKSRKVSATKKRLSDDHVYESISDTDLTDLEEPIYAEIGDYGDNYEEPKPTEPPLYLELDAPPLPPRRKDTRRTDSIYKAPSEKFSKHEYEKPIKKSTVEQIKRSSEFPIRYSDDRYEVPIKRSSQYEEPVKKSTVEQVKRSSEFPIKRFSDDQYEVPIKRSSHNQYEIPIKKSSDNQYEIPIERHSRDQYETPIKKSSEDHAYMDFLNDSDDHIYSEIPSDNEMNALKNGDEDNLFVSNSVSFEPVRSSTGSSNQIH